MLNFQCGHQLELVLTIGTSILLQLKNFIFHLWLPDMAMQFNSQNIPCLIIPSLYCFNNQYLKLKYGIPWNSATSSKEGNSYHFGKMFDNHWIERWGGIH